MTPYRLFGAETSPYSSKVRSFLDYKNINYDWVQKSSGTEEEFERHAKLASLPLIIDPKGKTSQESTQILLNLDKSHKEPTAQPEDKACQALCLVLEDYSDEWLIKGLFQSRWMRRRNSDGAAIRLLEQILSGQSPARKTEARRSVITHMQTHVAEIGVTDVNASVITGSFERFIALLNTHLEKHAYIFGGRPSLADFAIAGQFQQVMQEGGTHDWLEKTAPALSVWAKAMLSPKADAPFADLSELSETLLPIFRDEIAKTYLPWAEANSESLSKRRKEVTLELDGLPYQQKVQRHAAKSYRALKKTLEGYRSSKALQDFLKETGTDVFF